MRQGSGPLGRYLPTVFGLFGIPCRHLAGASHHFLGDEPSVLADLAFDFLGHFGVFPQERLGILAALADTGRIVREPLARLLNDASLDAEIE